jgi:uncharacterized integral membrane protein
MSLIRWIVGTLFALAAVLFAVGNLNGVSIVWSPVHPALDMPVSVFGLGMMALGFVLGGALVWINAQPLRRERRAQKKRIRDLETALEAANENASGADGPFLPASLLPPPPATPPSLPPHP